MLREILAPSPLLSGRERGAARSRSLSGSIGVACFPMHASTPAELIEAAAQAVSTAKAAGKTCVRAYQSETHISTVPFSQEAPVTLTASFVNHHS